jgi:hypothetical protein
MSPSKPRSEYLPWSVAGVLLVVLFVLVFWALRPDESPAQQLARKATRVDLVSRMQTALASASEAQRSAVLATTDEDSAAFAAQARTALGEVERAGGDLVPLLAAPDHERERGLLDRFSTEYGRLRRLDEEVLRLAVMNTNLKAYALAYGPATEAAEALDAALARLGAQGAGAAAAREAAAARIAVLRLRVRWPPHIAAERAEEMDRLEGELAAERRRATAAIQALAARPGLAGSPDLAQARARFAELLALEGRILALSRENTNVTSLALSLGQQRKAMSTCLAALDALQQAVQEEPIAGVAYGRLPNPTR